jgi:sirohydrochlorin ferrochelatase
MKNVTPSELGASHIARITVFAALCILGLTACEQSSQSTEGTVAAGREALASAPGQNMGGMDHAAMGHDHAMTPEQFTELRQKIPLYEVLSDDQIMANMGRMPPDWWEMLSPGDVQGNIGILALGHGYKLGGNEQFKEKVAPISKSYPTAVAPGMAMMSASHIQKAVDALTSEHGVDKIVVVPMEPGDESSLIHQWQYIFGLRDEAPYLSVPRVKTNARIVFTKSPATDPLVSTIMGDYARETATDPATARVILVSHGPERVEDNPAELARLRAHADRIRQNSEFTDIQVLSIQDDAIPDVRAANKAQLRDMIKEASDQGREVIIVPMILTRGGFHARLQKDLEGLNYEFANRGLIEHPAFQDWINNTVREAVG